MRHDISSMGYSQIIHQKQITNLVAATNQPPPPGPVIFFSIFVNLKQKEGSMFLKGISSSKHQVFREY